MNTDPILDKLDELVAATKAAAIPVNERWLDAAGVGALLSHKRNYVLNSLACRADFPKPMRTGHPRWKASEVLAWAERQRLQSRGRPRKGAGELNA